MTHETTMTETKALGTGKAAAHDAVMQAFEAYRETNDERLAALEMRGGDPLVEEKLTRIDRALDEARTRLDRLHADRNRPPLSGAGEAALPDEHKQAFDAYVRQGRDRALQMLDQKAMSVGSGPDGGYLAPVSTEAEVGRRLAVLSPIRQIASVRQVSGNAYRKPFTTSGPAAGWVAETASRPETDSATLAELVFPAMELYAMPAATQALLEDTAIDIDQWIAEEVEAAFAAQESTAFVTGNGVARPKGFLSETTIAESAWEWGKLGFIASGADGEFAATDGADVLVDLVHTLKAGYRQNGSFVMNRRTLSAVRKLKDADGNYLWTPPAAGGVSSSLMGFPVVEAEDMPDMATNSLSIAFGDFRRGYLIVDRRGISVLRDPYTAKPYVLFYTTKRVGGGVQDFDAIKLLKFAA